MCRIILSMTTTQAMNNLKKRWLEFLELEKGRSWRTLENYSRYLDRFLRWSRVSSPEQINLEVIQKYRLYLNRLQDPLTGEQLKPVTQNYHLIALRGFLRFLHQNNIKTMVPDRINLRKSGEREISFLEPEETERLLNAPLRKGSSFKNLRDGAILQLLFSTGMRVGELVALDRSQVRPDKKELTVMGKGRKLRVVFLSDEAHRIVQDYLKLRTDTDIALFIRLRKKTGPPENLRLTARSVERTVRYWAAAAGITDKKISPHTLRHSYATDLLRAGADIRSVQALLGHAHLTTTQIYTHITDTHLKKIHQKFHRRRAKD